MSHVRWTYLVATLLVCASLVHLKGEWGNSDSINAFNYWCGVTIHNTTSATMSREARHTLSDYLVRIKSSVETLERRGVEE